MITFDEKGSLIKTNIQILTLDYSGKRHRSRVFKLSSCKFKRTDEDQVPSM